MEKKHIEKFDIGIYVIIVLVGASCIVVVGKSLVLDLPYMISGEYPTMRGIVVDVHKFNNFECSVTIENSETKEEIKLYPIHSDHKVGDHVFVEYLPNQEKGYIKTIN